MNPSTVDVRRRWLLGAALAASVQPLAWSGTRERFRVFDGLLHRGKPDLRRYGLEPIVSVSAIWRAGMPHEEVDEGGVLAALERLPPQAATAYLDIENWPMPLGDPAAQRVSIGKLMRVCEVVRRAHPTLEFGIYGQPPLREYWPVIRHDRSYPQWLAADQAMMPIARLVDCIFPSLYTFYADPTGWLTFAAAQITEARRYAKPVYPFLWFQYHNSNRLLGGRDIDVGAWEGELRLCRARADGVVLWGGAGSDWNDDAPWWHATRRVLELSIV